MSEEMLGWSQHEPERSMPPVEIESEQERFAHVKERYFEAQEEIEKMKMDKKVKKTVTASFFDITGNLLQPLSMGMDAYEHTKNPELLELFESNLDYLDRYLALLESDPDIRAMELSDSDGAFPLVRQAAAQAKELGQGSIHTYIDLITDHAGEGRTPN